MQDLIRNLPAVIYAYSIRPNGTRKFDHVSDASESILGIPSQDLINNPTLLESTIHPEDVEFFKTSSMKAELLGHDWSWQGRIICKGSVKWLEFVTNHEQTVEGGVIRRGFIQDITARKERDILEHRNAETRIKKK